MTVAGSLALLAMFASGGPAHVPDSSKAFLGVTATVVRPVRISTAITESRLAVATIENSADMEVLTTVGTVTQANGNVLVSIPSAADSVYITLIF